ncbi:MAG: thiol reductant ABC exporter subunit CydD, partial [Pseudomonadota bacterium]
LLLLLLLAWLLRALLIGVRQWLAAGASAQARLNLRQRLLQSYADAAPGQLDSSGLAVTTYDEQVEALDGYYSRFLPQSIRARIIPLVLVIVVLWSDWVAGALLVLAVPLIPIFMILIGLGAQQLSETHYRSLARLVGWFLDQVQGASTIKLFQAEAQAVESVRLRTEQLRQTTLRVLRIAFMSSAVLEFFSAVAIASLAIYIGMGLLGYLTFGPAEALTLTSGLFILLLAPEVFQPIRTLSQGWHDRADARGAMVAISEQLNLAKARPLAQSDRAPQPRASCSVELKQIHFAYPHRRPLFESINLTIADGERVVMIGPSGGGKSSLIQLLAGFAHPQSGRILLDGQDLSRFSTDSLVEHVAWLGQRPVLFQGTIAANIAMGWSGACSVDIKRMARIARVDEFAERMPDGLNSAVGEGGFGLSGGQAQ